MKIKEVIEELELWAPITYQESYDNSGLIVGDKEIEITGALICLDSIEEVIDEAITKKCNLVIAHHPIVFSGLKTFVGKDYIQRTIIKAIKNDIAIYAIHTSLDHVIDGVNSEICNRLGLVNQKILAPKKDLLSKLAVFVPKDHLDLVRDEMFKYGAGSIGKYDECSFVTQGEGSFRASDNSKPHVGEIGERHYEAEVKIEVIVPNYRLHKVIGGMIAVHPYEEVAYDIHPMQNTLSEVGSGMIGNLEKEENILDFLARVKETFKAGAIKYTSVAENPTVKTVAVCGGSGSFLLNNATAQKADVFITSDFKYHQFFDGKGIVIADIGHFESEQFTIELIGRRLKEKFTTFAVHFTKVNTNPVNYL
jgi:dinuclear metal center YbgI/SA1388 family protein